MDDVQKGVIEGWIKKAESDFTTIRVLLNMKEEPIPFDTVCFHCQQATEKYLKGYLTLLDVLFPRTHSLVNLIEVGLVKDAGLSALDDAEILTPYGVTVRYPDDFYMPSQQEAENAYAIARKVQTYVLGKIGNLT